MLAIENAEIGGTLIALSIPGLKPLFDRFYSKVGVLHRSHPPSFNALSPSAVFASEMSKSTVVAEDRPMHPITNPWTGLGIVHYAGIPYDMASSTDDDAPPGRSLTSHPWRQPLGGMASYGGAPKV